MVLQMSSFEIAATGVETPHLRQLQGIEVRLNSLSSIHRQQGAPPSWTLIGMLLQDPRQSPVWSCLTAVRESLLGLYYGIHKVSGISSSLHECTCRQSPQRSLDFWQTSASRRGTGEECIRTS